MMKLVAFISLFFLMSCTTPVAQDEEVMQEEEATITKNVDTPLMFPGNVKCFPWRILRKLLLAKYNETNVSGGVLDTTHGRFIASFFISKEGTWTLTVTNPLSISCILAHGSKWKDMAPPQGGV